VIGLLDVRSMSRETDISLGQISNSVASTCVWGGALKTIVLLSIEVNVNNSVAASLGVARSHVSDHDIVQRSELGRARHGRRVVDIVVIILIVSVAVVHCDIYLLLRAL
jgi:hypothetical protein